MGKKLYEVTERSFINGRLCEPGDRIELHIDSPGTNLKEVGATQEKVASPATNTGAGGTGGITTTTSSATGNGFTSYHAGAGRYGIKDTNGERYGDFTGTKEEAEAEADRLNAPDPDLDDQDNDLPDA